MWKIEGLLDRGKINDIAAKLQQAIVEVFRNSGIYYRIFYRVKTEKSFLEKLGRGGYGVSDGKKRIQDMIGLRIVLYYADDLSIGRKLMQDTFLMVGNWERTENKEDQFSASKINGVFRIPEEFMANYKFPVDEIPVEPVFELQFRTMFFEGWHEIEHDMRYKTHFADDAFWKGNPELSRILNCIVANLELCDWSMIRLFDQLADYHYKMKNWEMMLKSKYRLRMSEQHLSKELEAYFNEVPKAAEPFYHCTRKTLIESLMGTVHGGITYDLIIRLLNEKYVHNEEIQRICERQKNIQGIREYQPLPLQRLEASDVFCLDVRFSNRKEMTLLEKFQTATKIVQEWAKEKMSDIFTDISGEPENARRQTLGYQLITSYNEEFLYYEMEMYYLDMEHPGTIWQMQVLIQRVRRTDEFLTLWVHSICRHPRGMSSAVKFHKPLFVHDLSAKIGLEDVELLRTTPVAVSEEETYERLIKLIHAEQRRLPIVILAASMRAERSVTAEQDADGKQLRRKKGEFYGILHAGKLAHIIGMYAHVYLLDQRYSEKFGEDIGKSADEVMGSVSIFDCRSVSPSEFFSEEQILRSRFDYNRYVYYEGDVYEKAFRHKLVEMMKRKLLEKHP